MEFIAIAFHVVSFLLAILAAALLLFVNQERKHSNQLLACIILLFACQNLIHILLFSQLILRVPWMLRAFAPTTFLIGPVVYIYFRSILYDEISFRKYDWVFILPGILIILNFIPYYILAESDKINYLNEHYYSQNPSQDSGRGILPTSIYYTIRVCWSGFFLLLYFRTIYRFRKNNSPELLANNKVLLNWLFTFNCLLAAIWVVTVFNNVIPQLGNMQIRIINILFGATIFFICLQLFIRPQILYGVFQPLHGIKLEGVKSISKDDIIHETVSDIKVKEEADQELPQTTIQISQSDQLRYKTIIEAYFRREKPYLQTTYSLEQMANDTQIPRYLLSALINREYGIGFREFLNRYRVNYFKDNIKKSAWNNLTLEAIAEDCGFQSRSTFINNFKKITGQTPSDYLKNNI